MTSKCPLLQVTRPVEFAFAFATLLVGVYFDEGILVSASCVCGGVARSYRMWRSCSLVPLLAASQPSAHVLVLVLYVVVLYASAARSICMWLSARAYSAALSLWPAVCACLAASRLCFTVVFA